MFFTSSFRRSSSASTTSTTDFLINGGLLLLLTSLMYYCIASYERFKLDSLFIPTEYATMPFFEIVTTLEPAITIFLPAIFLLTLIILSLVSPSSISTFGTSGSYTSSTVMSEDLAKVRNFSGLFAITLLFLSYLIFSSSDYYSSIYTSLFMSAIGFFFVLFRSLYAINFNDKTSDEDDYKHLNFFDQRIFIFSFGLIFLFLLPFVLVLYTLTYDSNKGFDLLIMDSCTEGVFEQTEELVDIKKLKKATHYICKAIVSENKDGFVTWRNLYINKEDVLTEKGIKEMKNGEKLQVPISFDNKIYRDEINNSNTLREVSLDWDISFDVDTGIKSKLSTFILPSEIGADYTDQKNTKSVFQLIDIKGIEKIK